MTHSDAYRRGSWPPTGRERPSRPLGTLTVLFKRKAISTRPVFLLAQSISAWLLTFILSLTYASPPARA